MDKTIYKYQLKVEGIQKIELPTGSKILTVQNQAETACMWCLIDRDIETKETRVIEILGTGHDVFDDEITERKYINTFQLQGGALVFHAFERIS